MGFTKRAKNPVNGISTKILLMSGVHSECILNKMEERAFEETLTEVEIETDTELLFTVGESFGNYEALEKKLKDFEKASFSQFWK